jgi:hypothetical protein
MVRSLQNITPKEFISFDINDLNTWPYLPLGLLKQPTPAKSITEELVKTYNEEWNEAERFVECFSEKQKASLGWIFAASIGVLGNLVVNLAFAPPALAGNLYLMFLVLVIITSLTVAYLLFLPGVTLVFRFVPAYLDFPRGYEKHISKAPCTGLYSQIVFQYNNLHELVAEFGSLIRLTILKDRLCSSLRKSSHVHISEIRKIDDYLPACFVEISTNGIKPWLSPKGRERIRFELRQVIQAMMDARQLCSVRGFELDPKEWDAYGCSFIDGVSQWKLKEMQNDVVNYLKANCKLSSRN